MPPPAALYDFWSGVFQKGAFPKGWFWRMFPRNENQNEGTFGWSPGTKTGTRSYEGTFKGWFSKRVVLADVPPERKPEPGHIRQNHPFTKLPYLSPSDFGPFGDCTISAHLARVSSRLREIVAAASKSQTRCMLGCKPPNHKAYDLFEGPKPQRFKSQYLRERQSVKDTPSPRSIVDFSVWFSR